METTCSKCILTPLHAMWHFLWPILSILLGTAAGCLFSVLISASVFLLTLVRTPMHVVQMLCVTATTTECFKWHCPSFPLRTVVLLAVPIAHLLFLAGITIFSATFGTLYYIGKATKMFYKHEYKKSAQKIQSNARMEPKSKLGEYYKACQEFMEDDEYSYPVIYLLKGLFALIPGVVVAALAMAPFSLAVLVISLVRLPVNVYKTMKIALFTVVLRWDLRLVVLTTLPLIHAIFPLVTFLCAIVGSFFGTWAAIVNNIVADESLLDIGANLRDKLKDYYKAHQEFVGERCNRYDHSSGIPYGWDGQSYGIDFERLLRWQWDFVVVVLAIILGTPLCLLAACLLSTFKYLPSVTHWWQKYIKECCCSGENNFVTILSLWPLHMMAIVLMPVGALICHIALVLYSALRFPFQVVEYYYKYYFGIYVRHGGTCRAVRAALAESIQGHDRCTAWLVVVGDGEDWVILSFKSGEPGGRNDETTPIDGMNTGDDQTSTQAYWDRFVSQCISTTALLIEKGSIRLEDVQGLEPSIIQSIPAVAILDILVDSVNDKSLNHGDLNWRIDGTVCTESGRPMRDGIACHLWPMVSSIDCKLRKEQTEVLTGENIKVLIAMLTANNESETDNTKEILAEADPNKYPLNNAIRTMINGLVMAILRVKPYQERMNLIFTHEYGTEDLEQQIMASPATNEEDGIEIEKSSGVDDAGM